MSSPAVPTAAIGTLRLLAPATGILVPLDHVPDPVFAQRLAGDGISLEPLSDRIVAPCDARVLQVHRSRHALTLDVHGLEIVIHVGLDTVGLQGDGFVAQVAAGQHVRTGDTLLQFDPDRVARRARSLLTQMLVANMDRVASLTPRSGRVFAGEDVVLEVTLTGAASTTQQPGTEPATAASEATVQLPPVRVHAAAGLHARPAAVIASTVRRFTADVRLLKGTREANARSVVSIMALEAAHGDEVAVIARGDDAQQAAAAIIELIATIEDAPATVTVPAAPAPARAADRSAIESGGVLRGVGASPGLAIGNVFQLRLEDVVVEERASDPHRERRELEAALGTARLQLETLQSRLAAEAQGEGEGEGDKAAIFAAHQELLEDPELLDRAEAEIRAGASAAHAWRQAYTAQADMLARLENPLLAGRATDLRDVGRRVLHLLAGRESAAPTLPQEAIVVAEDLTPSDTASLDRTRVRGFCTTMGSATSHVAILARGLGIPAVAGIDPRVLDLPTGTRVVLDGDAGTLKPAPSPMEEAAIALRRSAQDLQRQQQLATAAQPALTRDGHRVKVLANIGTVADAARVAEMGGEGVGLLRTEFLFMDRRSAPDEDEQTQSYTAILRELGGTRLLVARTLDVGGDKPLPYVNMGSEANPFLGERGVRLTLNRPELFRDQVRAILRASRNGPIAIMFPMIATLAEWRAARALVEEERAALGVETIPVGIMVETAAAALLAGHFAREADFFSIGTNDLTQYTLAMDRTNPRLASQVDALHPSVLQLIERTVAGAHAHGRWVDVCGALAGDARAIPVLIGLGVDELSADVPLVPAVKARIRGLSIEECRTTAQEALVASDGEEVRRIVELRHG